MKRLFDLLLGVAILMLLVVLILLIAIAIRLTSKGPALYWSDRVGSNNKIFKMPKFRSMLIGTPAVATHLLDNLGAYLSPIEAMFTLVAELYIIPVLGINTVYRYYECKRI